METHQEIINKAFGYAVIYKLTSPSGKSYIGQTINFKERYSVYRRRKKNSIGKRLYHALNKYNGIENFEVEILTKVIITENVIELREKLKELEIFYIKEYDTFNSGYNLTIGGEGALGRVLSEETKEKISKANKGNNAVPDVTCVCDGCGKEFKIQPHIYNNKIKRTKSGKIYCSSKCGAGIKKTFVTGHCGYCGKEIILEQHAYNKRLKESVSKKIFCNSSCGRKFKTKK